MQRRLRAFGTPARIPIEADAGAISNTVDHFIPSIAADPSTSGATAHLALFYYFYPVSNCNYIRTSFQRRRRSASRTFGYVVLDERRLVLDVADDRRRHAVARGARACRHGQRQPRSRAVHEQLSSRPRARTRVAPSRIFALGATVNGLDESMYVPIDGLGVGGGS